MRKEGKEGGSDQTVGRTSTEGFPRGISGFSATNEPGFQRAQEFDRVTRQLERFLRGDFPAVPGDCLFCC